MDQAQTTGVKITAPHELFKREYQLGDLLTLAWRLFADNFKAILIVTLIVYVPIELISLIIPAAALSNSTSVWQYVLTANTFIIVALFGLAGILVPLAIAYIIRKNLDGQVVDYQTALRQALSKWLPGIATSVVMGIFLLGLYILLVIPGIIFTIYWAFTLYIVILNNKSGMEALKYSREVVKGRWWKTMGYLLVFAIIVGVINWAITMPLGSLSKNAIVGLVASLISDVLLAFTTVATVLLFLNMESVKPTPAIRPAS